MTSKEYIIWLRGFTEGVHDFNVTPKQWDIMKEKLAEVSDDEKRVGTPVGIGGWGAPNGTSPINPAITTTPGTGYITVANPNIASFGGVSSITYTTGSSLGVGVNYTVTSGSAWSGGTTYTYPNGTTVSYTAGGANEFDDPKDKTLLHD